MNLNGKITNPGDLRTSVTIQTPTIVQGTGGAQTVSWSNLATVWSGWVHAHGSENLMAQAVQSQALATVRIRYRADVTEQCSILKGAERWQIIAPPEDIQELHEYMDLSVRLVKGSV